MYGVVTVQDDITACMLILVALLLMVIVIMLVGIISRGK